MKIQFDENNDHPIFELAPAGDYPFEVMKLGHGILSSFPTKRETYNNVEALTLTLRLFKDATFTDIQGEITDDLLDVPFLHWKAVAFIKATGLKAGNESPKDGQELVIDEDNSIGLRGWCRVIIEDWVSKKTGKSGKSNRVETYYIDREKITRHEPEEDDAF